MADGVQSLRVERAAYFAVQEAQRQAQLPPLLLALHGWGQNAPRFLRDFATLRGHNILVCAPQAPNQFYLDMATKKVGFHWLTVYEKAQGIADTNSFLQCLLERLKETHPFDHRRIYLMGFSQGVSMAWRFAVSGLVAPVGFIHVAADLPPDVEERLPNCTPFPVLLARGREDSLIPESLMSAAKEALARNHYPCDEFDYDAGHVLTEELVLRISAWIGEQ